MEPVTLEMLQKEHPLYKRVQALGIPGNKTEHYRKFGIKPILSETYNIKIPTQGTPVLGKKIIIEDGVLQEYPKEVSFCFSDDFLVDMTHYDALYFMSHILCKRVINLQVTKDATFEIEHRLTGTKSFVPYRIALQTQENTQVEVFEHFQTKATQESLLLYGVDVHVAKDSTLRWVRNENIYANEATVIGSHHYRAVEQSELKLHTFDFGSGRALHVYKIDLDAYAKTHASHLLLATKKAQRGNIVYINHHGPHAKSLQESRTILKDSATGIFDGKILIGREAKYSKTKQDSKAILLSDHAHMYTKPQLEIYIDELEASHGSTIGELDKQALFYMRSRGIRIEDARKILVSAFANALIETLEDAKYEEQVRIDFELALQE